MSKKKKFKYDALAESMISETNLASNNFMGNGSGSGPSAGGMTKPKKMSILDLVKTQDDLIKKQDDMPGTLPYPLDHSALDKFAEAYFAIDSIKTLIRQTVNNPLITGDKENKKAVKSMYEKCSKIQKIIELCGNDLDALLPEQE